MNTRPPANRPEGLSRAERLRSPEAITGLFRTGKRLRKGGLSLIFGQLGELSDGSAGVQAAFTAPRRLHPRAVRRNRYKRLLREAYRRNRGHYLDGTEGPLGLLFIYQSREDRPYRQIEAEMIALLERLKMSL